MLILAVHLSYQIQKKLKMEKTQTFIIIFGSGKEAVILTEQGVDLFEVLSKLDRNGWIIKNITKIKINPINI